MYQTNEMLELDSNTWKNFYIAEKILSFAFNQALALTLYARSQQHGGQNYFRPVAHV